MPSSPSPSPSSSFRLLIPTPTRLTSVVRLSRARLSPGWLTNHRSSTPSTLALIHQPASKKPTIRSSTDSRAVVDLSLISAGVLSLGLTIVWLKRSTGSGKVSSSRDDDQLGFIRPTNSLNSDNSSTSQFEIPISSHTGSPAGKKILTMLSSDQVDKLLKKYENSFKLDRVGNPVYRYDTNHVASNSPIEDDCICALVSRDHWAFQLRDQLQRVVICYSSLLVQRLVQAVNRELSSVFLGEPEYMAAYLAKEIINSPPRQISWFFIIVIQEICSGHYLDQDDDLVKLAIQNAFIRLDQEIVSRGPIEMLKTYEAQIKSGDGKPLPRSYGSELTPRQTESLQALLPSLSGSCALVHVLPEDNWGRGKWKALVLSEDQEGTNPNEWPVGISEPRPDPSDYRTPPYVTAKPEVSSASLLGAGHRRVVDRLDTAEVVGLVGRCLRKFTNPRVMIFRVGKNRSKLLLVLVRMILSRLRMTHPWGSAGGDKSFIFEDDNVATHLIRNALGGSSREKVGALLSIPAPHSRRYRDDITLLSFIRFIDPKKVKTDDSSKDSGNSRDSLRGKLEKGLMKNVDVGDQIRSKL
ncbi:hypothetical protein PPACK8108_LOCUS16534 [Phakopsora pachyrhizi]|uniref:Uncharacterized protein n=1 Tax=Phakopsora pachyrhizi TaxID=170000 RepID=A0AAV0B7Z5_PHAPC|nr:hypothetical protein PPACK8108_LOCUS16534 [Phakopsora pachyrhizi]